MQSVVINFVIRNVVVRTFSIEKKLLCYFVTSLVRYFVSSYSVNFGHIKLRDRALYYGIHVIVAFDAATKPIVYICIVVAV